MRNAAIQVERLVQSYCPRWARTAARFFHASIARCSLRSQRHRLLQRIIQGKQRPVRKPSAKLRVNANPEGRHVTPTRKHTKLLQGHQYRPRIKDLHLSATPILGYHTTSGIYRKRIQWMIAVRQITPKLFPQKTTPSAQHHKPAAGFDVHLAVLHGLPKPLRPLVCPHNGLQVESLRGKPLMSTLLR